MTGTFTAHSEISLCGVPTKETEAILNVPELLNSSWRLVKYITYFNN
jgi:hypothetical protein